MSYIVRIAALFACGASPSAHPDGMLMAAYVLHSSITIAYTRDGNQWDMGVKDMIT